MKSRRTVGPCGVGLGGVVVALIALAVGGSTAHAQGEGQRVDLAPASGPAGTTVQVTGAGCPPDAEWPGESWAIGVRTLPGNRAPTQEASVIEPSDDDAPGGLDTDTAGYPGRVETQASAAEDGTWAAELTIPADTPPGEYPVAAVCFGDEGGKYGYPTPVFTVAAESGQPGEEGQETATVPELPRTGVSQSMAMLAIGALFLAATGAVLLVVRRRGTPA